MGKIISMSLSEALLREIDELEKTAFSGRSDVIRSGVKMLIDDMKEKERLRGHGECIMIIMHNKKFENSFIKTKHKYEKITQFLSDTRKNKRADYVKLVVP